MCGIAGILAAAGGEQLRTTVRQMVAAMRRRGPDGEGVWAADGVALGHARLSIIDVTSAANQPMVDPVTGAVIVYNGEIYNYIELRQELVARGHQFTTKSDTEVLLHAYREWGSDAFARCVGMWAVAIQDPRTRTLLLSRDRFGIKPLFLHRHADGTLVFGSTPRVVLSSGIPDRAVDPSAVRAFLLHRSVDESVRSFYAGIERFPAATTAVIDLGDPGFPISFERYWDPASLSERPAAPISFSDAVSEFRRLLTESVGVHTRSDVEVSSCLSGGLDSSSLVSMLASIPEGRDIRKVFSAVFPGLPYDEERYSAAVAERYQLERIAVRPDTATFLADIQHVVAAQEEPFGSTGVYVQWKVFEAIHTRGIKVTIDGQGADEYLAGYLSFLAPYAGECLRRGDVVGALRAWRTYQAGSQFTHHLWQNLPALVTRLFGLSSGATRSAFQQYLSPALGVPPEEGSDIPSVPMPRGSGVKAALIRYLTKHSLPALLRYEDRNSMYFSLESRVPFLDHRMVEFALSLPVDYLLDGHSTKRVLREGVRDIVPEVVWNRKDKIGFGNPEADWVRALVGSGVFHDLLSGAQAKDIFEAEALRRNLDGRQWALADTNFLWRVLSVLLWQRQAFG